MGNVTIYQHYHSALRSLCSWTSVDKVTQEPVISVISGRDGDLPTFIW